MFGASTSAAADMIDCYGLSGSISNSDTMQ